MQELFANFLSDEKIYDQAVAYWNKLCKRAFEEYSQTKEWGFWLNTKLVNGTIMRDGNPITSWINAKEKKGIVIVQTDRSYMPIIAYMDIFDKGISNIEELVIHCFLTEQTSITALKYIKLWVSGDYSFEMMEKELSRY